MTRPGYESGNTPANELPPPTTGIKPAPPPRPHEWITQRTVDEVRATALEAAVNFWRGRDLSRDERQLANLIVNAAETFEAYLLGEDPSAARPPGHGVP